MALTLHGTVSDNTVALDRKTATPLIINGDMQIAQRGTSTSSITLGNYRTLDRFYINNGGIGSFTNIQSTDVPTGQGFASSFKLDCDTSDSPTGTEWLSMVYRTEAQDLRPLKFNTSSAEEFTISFWVKSSKTGTYTLGINNNDSARGISQTYTINSANTWEKKVLSFAGDTAGAIANDNGIGLILYWVLSAGADRKSSPLQTSWGAYDSTAFVDSSQVNLGDSTSNDWYITGVQLEVGSFDANSIPPFQFEDRGTSLMRCMRYTQCFGGNNNKETFCSGGCNTTTIQTMLIEHKTEMRTTPSVSVSALNDFQVVVPSGFTTAATAITLATDNSGPTASTITTNTTSQAASQVGRYCNLRCVDVTNGKLTLSAEL